MSFPRRLDPDLAARVLPVSLGRYRAAAATFAAWCATMELDPWTCEDWDNAIIAYKNATQPRKAALETLIAAVEFYFPRFKHHLIHARAALDGRARTYIPKHHVPMGRASASLAACHIASMGHTRLAGGLVVQQRRGLRPGELLGLVGNDIVLPEERILDGAQF